MENMQTLGVDENYCRSCGSIIKKEAELCLKCGVRQVPTVFIDKAAQERISNVDNIQETISDETTVKYAGFWVRFVAAFLDGIIIWVGSIVVSILLALIAIIPVIGVVLYVLGLIFLFFASFVYYIILTNKYQATLGKMAVGIKVIEDDNKGKASFGKIILRETIGKISSALILFAGYIMAGFTRRKQALHDMIGSTVVVYKDPNKKNNTVIIISVIIICIIFMVAVIGILSSIVLVSLSSARDKAAVAAFKAEVSSIVPSMIIACDEKKLISVDDLGTPKYFNPTDAFKTLSQNCTNNKDEHFLIKINGIESASSESAICTENGCTFN